MQGPELSCEFTITISLPHRARARVRVSGDIDRAATTCLGAQLAGLLDVGVEQVRLDLSEAHQFDYHLLEVLGRVRARLHTRGGRLITTGTVGDLLTQTHSAMAVSGTAVSGSAAPYHQVAVGDQAYPETFHQP